MMMIVSAVLTALVLAVFLLSLSRWLWRCASGSPSTKRVELYLQADPALLSALRAIGKRSA